MSSTVSAMLTISAFWFRSSCCFLTSYSLASTIRLVGGPHGLYESIYAMDCFCTSSLLSIYRLDSITRESIRFVAILHFSNGFLHACMSNWMWRSVVPMYFEMMLNTVQLSTYAKRGISRCQISTRRCFIPKSWSNPSTSACIYDSIADIFKNLKRCDE